MIIRQKHALSVSLVWMLWISGWTVVAVAPERLNADILLNSVMALQKLTLFYWGQDRLLNVLPFTVALIRDPGLNLAAVLFLSALSFNLLLHAAAWQAARLLDARNAQVVTAQVFISMSGLYLFIFTTEAVAEISIGHIEYSLSALMLALAVWKFLPPGDHMLTWRGFLVASILLVISLGMNPSSLIAAGFIVLCVAYRRRSCGRREAGVILVALGAFVFWRLVTIQGGTGSYFVFLPRIFLAGADQVARGLLGTLNLKILIPALLVGVLAGRLLWPWREAAPNASLQVLGYLRDCVIVFSAGWLILFASNLWVELNGFAWRYFIYVIIACLLLVTAYLVRLFGVVGPGPAWGLTGAIMLGASLVTVSAPKPFSEYRVFQQVDALTLPGRGLYGGDYWVVWPSVLRDMMAGHEAYGLVYRGQANRDAARDFVLRQVRDHGHAELHCLNVSLDTCLSSAQGVVGPLDILGADRASGSVTVVKISAQADSPK